jgi:hypothetical protein
VGKFQLAQALIGVIESKGGRIDGLLFFQGERQLKLN